MLHVVTAGNIQRQFRTGDVDAAAFHGGKIQIGHMLKTGRIGVLVVSLVGDQNDLFVTFDLAKIRKIV